MSLLKYLIPLWAGVFVYVICSVFTGPTGLSAYKQLAIEQQKLQANIESLANLNQELENSRNALVDDADTIAMYARDLGYGYNDERFIRIIGVGGSPKQYTDSGQILLALKPEHTSNSVIIIFSLSIALGLFACILLPDLIRMKQVKAFRPKVKAQWHAFRRVDTSRKGQRF
jgi:hypothetical protein